MFDVFNTGKLLAERAVEKYKNDIGIIAYYGSYAQGLQTDKSDIDMFYIPDSDKDFYAGHTLLINNYPFDFYPIGWDRLERMANFDEKMTSIIAHAKVLYYRSEDDLERFNNLKSRVKELQSKDKKRHMVEKAMNKYKGIAYNYQKLDYAISTNDLFSIKYESWRIIEELAVIIAILNQEFYDRDLSKCLNKIDTFKVNIDSFTDKINVIIQSEDINEIKKLSKALIDETRNLLIDEYLNFKISKKRVNWLENSYPEIKEQLLKIINCSKDKNYISTMSAVMQIQNELAQFLGIAFEGIDYNNFFTFDEYRSIYDSYGLPNLLLPLLKKDFNSLIEETHKFDKIIREILTSNGISLNEYKDINHFLSK